MKPYALKNFSERYLRHNIKDIGVNVWTDCSNIKDEWLAEYGIKNGVTEYGDDFVNLWLTDAETVCVDPYDVDYCMDSHFDEWVYDDFITGLIKSYDHYLVCAYNCRWDGASGYKITDSIEEALYRDYNVSQYYKGGTQGGKSIVITEYHHDVPMGHSTIIIGLTNKEYDRLNHWDVDFKTVLEFANRKSKSIIEI